MVTLSWVAAFAGLFLASHEFPQETAVPPRLSWLNPPQVTQEDYPVVATYLNVRGNAAVKCIANADGYARECVATAYPEGFGFEQTAIEIAKRGKLMANWDGDTPENLTFSFNIPFGDNFDELLPPSGPWDGPEPTDGQLSDAKNIVERIKSINGHVPFEGKIPKEIKAALASELAPENAAFLNETINSHGLTETENEALSIRMYARMLTLSEVENRIERIIDFSDPQVRARMIRAEGGEGWNSAGWRINNAYCSRYDCTTRRAEEPETPSHWHPRDDEPFPPYQGAD